MGVKVTYGTAGATGGGWSAQPGTLQPSFEEHEGNRLPVDSWQARGAKAWRDRNRWACLWPTMRAVTIGGMDGAGTDGSAMMTPMFECFSCDGAGTQTTKFIKGQVVDASDVAVSGAIVAAYRTSDDAFGGFKVTSRDDGSFDCPTQHGAVNHYLVAYKPGSPDVGGTTVNTLMAANVDGT